MKTTIRFVEITYFPQINKIQYRLSKERPSKNTLTGIERYTITYNQSTVPQTVLNYISSAKYGLTWDTETEHKSCAVGNNKDELEHLQTAYSAIKYITNFRISER